MSKREKIGDEVRRLVKEGWKEADFLKNKRLDLIISHGKLIKKLTDAQDAIEAVGLDPYTENVASYRDYTEDDHKQGKAPRMKLGYRRKQPKAKCCRCGRSGHAKHDCSGCFATTTRDGVPLDKNTRFRCDNLRCDRFDPLSQDEKFAIGQAKLAMDTITGLKNEIKVSWQMRNILKQELKYAEEAQLSKPKFEIDQKLRPISRTFNSFKFTDENKLCFVVRSSQRSWIANEIREFDKVTGRLMPRKIRFNTIVHMDLEEGSTGWGRHAMNEDELELIPLQA